MDHKALRKQLYAMMDRATNLVSGLGGEDLHRSVAVFGTSEWHQYKRVESDAGAPETTVNALAQFIADGTALLDRIEKLKPTLDITDLVNAYDANKAHRPNS